MFRYLGNNNKNVDGAEDDTIIIYDSYPNERRLLKRVKIITPEGEYIRDIIKTRKGGYLFN